MRWTKESNKGWKNEWNFEKEVDVQDADDDTCVHIKDNKIHAVVSKKAEHQIKTLCNKYEKLEWMAGMVGSLIDGTQFYVEELKLFDQEVEGSHVELTPKGNRQAARVNLLGFIHSHNTMGVFNSSTDVTTGKMYPLSITTNNDTEFDAKAMIELPCGKKVLGECEVYLEESMYTPDEKLLKETEELIREKKEEVEEKLPSPSPKDYTNKECPVCYNRVKNNRKSIICGACDMRVHKKCSEDMICKACMEDGQEIIGHDYPKKGRYYE